MGGNANVSLTVIGTEYLSGDAEAYGGAGGSGLPPYNGVGGTAKASVTIDADAGTGTSNAGTAIATATANSGAFRHGRSAGTARAA